jgi:hypothetical protein
MPTIDELSKLAIADYRAVAGRVVALNEVDGYRGDDSVTIILDPPTIAVIDVHGSEAAMLDNVLHGDADAVDPYYDVTLVGDDARLVGVRSLWTYGTCRTTGGGVEPAPFTLASPVIQRFYGRRIVGKYLHSRTGRPDRDYQFDATDTVLALPTETVHALVDGLAYAAELAPRGDGFPKLEHSQPAAAVFVVKATLAYFGVKSLGEITDEMVEASRAERGLEPRAAAAFTP